MSFKLSAQDATENGARFEVEVVKHGATVQRILVPDKTGRPVDVILGFEDVGSYAKFSDRHVGGMLGRVAGNIKHGEFRLDGKTFRLQNNCWNRHLHGGHNGFHTKLWSVASSSPNHVTMVCASPDMDQGYPGCLTVRVTFSLQVQQQVCMFIVDISAVSSTRTPCCLGPHLYFNLNGIEGNPEPDFTDHECQFDSEFRLENDIDLDQELIPVKGTVYDFTTPKNLGEAIKCALGQNRWYAFDKYFAVKKRIQQEKQPVVSLLSRSSGIRLRIFTDQPGFHFYSGDWLAECKAAGLKRRSGVCFRMHGFSGALPDDLPRKSLPSIVLDPGSVYRNRTVFAFDVSQSIDN